MIIASINNDTKKVKLVSVYRDTYLCLGEDEDENNSYGLANSAYCTGGAKKMINMLNKNLDMNISDFVTVNFQAVAETVELLGGIDVEMKKEEVVHLNNYCVETSEVTGWITPHWRNRGCAASERCTGSSLCTNPKNIRKRFPPCGKTEGSDLQNRRKKQEFKYCHVKYGTWIKFSL